MIEPHLKPEDNLPARQRRLSRREVFDKFGSSRRSAHQLNELRSAPHLADGASSLGDELHGLVPSIYHTDSTEDNNLTPTNTRPVPLLEERGRSPIARDDLQDAAKKSDRPQ